MQTYMHKSAVLLGAKNDAKLTSDIDKIIHLETNLAKALHDHPLNLLRMGSFSGLNNATHNRIDWVDVINSLLTATGSKLAHFKESDTVLSQNMDYLNAAATVLDETPEEVVQNLFGWFIVHVFNSLTTKAARENYNVFQEAISGIPRHPSTPDYCFMLANSRLAWATGRIYVDSHFTPEDKKEATTLVNEIRSAFRSTLQSNTWLDQTTKQLALEKLEAIVANVGYPDWVLDNSVIDSIYEHLKGLNVTKGKFFEAAVELNVRTVRHQFDTMHSPLNHTLNVPMTPSTVNAA